MRAPTAHSPDFVSHLETNRTRPPVPDRPSTCARTVGGKTFARERLVSCEGAKVGRRSPSLLLPALALTCRLARRLVAEQEADSRHVPFLTTLGTRHAVHSRHATSLTLSHPHTLSTRCGAHLGRPCRRAWALGRHDQPPRCTLIVPTARLALSEKKRKTVVMTKAITSSSETAKDGFLK